MTKHQNNYKIIVRFKASFPGCESFVSDAPHAYIADFTQRTSNVRGIEFFENNVPNSPEGNVKMDVFSIDNPHRLSFCFGVFPDAQFEDEFGKNVQHTEGVFFPSFDNDDCWVAFLEIKDCKPKNAVKYNTEMKQKVINSKRELNRLGIITPKNRYYGIASFPRKKLDFNDTIFNDPFEQKELVKATGVIFFATNSVMIDQETVKPIF